jgi:acyl-CoA synthetase (NDP forming)
MHNAAAQTAANLAGLFNPQHVAVIGASSTPGKIGNNVVRNLLSGGYAGIISPVNAGGTPVEGRPGYASLKAVPGQVDVAFIVVPAAAAVGALADCAAAGVKFAVIGASGFAELGDDTGIGRQAALLEIARQAGIRLIGPNTNGILSTTSKLALGYNASHATAMTPGSVSVVSHSGALFDGVARRLQGFGAGLAKFIPVGNEADLDMLEFFEYLISDPDTAVIGLIIEGLSDGARFRRLAVAAAAAGKPVVALKVGRSAAGASAALAHSSRLAGSARAYQALFAQAGVAAVPSVEALAGACALLAGLPAEIATDDRLICISSSGAGGALVMDLASERQLPIAGQADGTWPPAIEAEIAKLPAVARIRQPVDLGSLGDWALLFPVLEILNHAGMHGPVVAYSHIAAQEAMTQALLAALKHRRATVPGPVLLLAPGGLGDAVETQYVAAGIPVFHDSATCFDALSAFYIARLAVPPVLPAPAPLDAPRQAEVAALLAAASPGIDALSELESAAILRRMGVALVPSVTAATPAEAVAHAPSYPLVLKGLVPGIAHKFAHGLVKVGLADAAALITEFTAMQARAAALAPGAESVFILQPMLPSKAELILGLSVEGPLGTFLVTGFGGVNAEILDEVILFAVPVAAAAITEQLAASRMGRLLAALGGADAAGTLAAVTDSLMALQALALEQPGAIRSVDINPLLITKTGGIAVDALIVRGADHS